MVLNQIQPSRLLLVSAILIFLVTLQQIRAPKASCPQSSVCDGKKDFKPCSVAFPNVHHALVAAEIRRSNTSESRFYGFCVRVDEMSQITLAGSMDYLNGFNETAQVRLRFGREDFDVNGTDSTEWRYVMQPKTKVEESPLYVTYLTAVVYLDTGVLEGVVFEKSCTDDGTCVFGAGVPCVRNTDCGAKDTGEVKSSDMDIKIFIAWQGSDVAMMPLRSGGRLPSKFRAFAWSGYYNQLWKAVSIPN